MFAVSGIGDVIISTAAIISSGAILGIARATMKLIKARQTKEREDTQDLKSVTTFFFGEDANPRTGTPAKTGWTTKVDNTLQTLSDGQLRTEHAVKKILGEVVPNGGHNLRGAVERAAGIAGVEAADQTTERKRVQERDAEHDK